MDAPALLKSIGRYEILEEVGRGATSIVYAARDIFSGDKVAMKCQEFDFGAEHNRAQVMETFFLNEAALAGKLSHPFIVGVLDAGREGNLRYIVMEFVEGESLRSFCNPEHLLPLDQVLDIVFKCCLALEHSSQHGVIHRDIKPANIIRMPDGNVKIADFGAAIVASEERTVVTGVGSPAYMSPEQASDQTLDFHTDMYSLGVVAFHLLTGQLPFKAESSFQLLQRIVSDSPPPLTALRPDLPRVLDDIVGRAMHKKPQERYATFGDFARELSQLTSKAYLPPNQITDTEKFNSLRKLRFFADFNDSELWEVVHMSQWQRCRRGTLIIKEGERGDAFCILARGEATVTREGREVGTIEAGDCFGEMLYLSSGRIARSASVLSKTDSTLLVINPEQLERASYQCQVHFNKRFFEVLVNRLLEADKRIAAVQRAAPVTPAPQGRARRKAEEPLTYASVESCRGWVAGLAGDKPPALRQALAGRIGEIRAGEMPAAEKLALLEVLREPLARALHEMASHHADKPLPLRPVDQALWQEVADTWSDLGKAYEACLDPGLPGLALALHRALSCAGAHMREHYRIHLQLPDRLWDHLHTLYGAAVHEGVAEEAVADPLNPEVEHTTCAAAYIHALLLYLANPYRMGAHALALVSRLLDRWSATRVTMVDAPSTRLSGDMVAAGVEKGSGAVVIKVVQHLDHPRYLDTDYLAASIRKRVKLLRKGVPPAELGLNASEDAAELEALLVELYHEWCWGAPDRSFKRRSGAERAKVCLGFESIHHFVTGGDKARPGGGQFALKPKRHELEDWGVRNESALGFGMARAAEGGARVMHDQLLGVCPVNARQFSLGSLHWLKFGGDQQIQAGIALLPGTPVAGMVRLDDSRPGEAVQAFLLTPLMVIGEEASLILPPGCFQPGRTLAGEFGGERQRLTLVARLGRGRDFERVSFYRA